MTPRALILGGTGEARSLAKALVAQGIPVISSLAGRVSNPRLPVGEVRIGGFGGVDGLAKWLRDNEIRAVVDATHPFAAQITAHAAAACAETGVELLRLVRPPWAAEAGDRWTEVSSIDEAAEAVAALGGRVLLTTGRQDVGAFSEVRDSWFLIRVVDPPNEPLPPQHQILRARGPYGLDDERALLQANHIDVLVTKNSGGELTRAKLIAARELSIPVIVVQRPAEPAGVETCSTVPAATAWVATHLAATPA